jgi:hypothetical protein
MEEVVQEIKDELGFGMVPNVFATAQTPDIQTALWKSFRHVVLRGVLPQTVKEMMGYWSRGLGAHATLPRYIYMP